MCSSDLLTEAFAKTMQDPDYLADAAQVKIDTRWFGPQRMVEVLQQIDAALKGAAEALSGNQVGAMIGARSCIGYDSTTQRYVVAVAWQGSSAGFDPTGWTAAPDVAKNCAKGLYGAENMRRVVWNTLMVANLS